MAVNKRVTLHPAKEDGSPDLGVNLYPKTLETGILDINGNPVNIPKEYVDSVRLDELTGNLVIVNQDEEELVYSIPDTITKDIVLGQNANIDIDKNLVLFGKGELLKIHRIEDTSRLQIVSNGHAYTLPDTVENSDGTLATIVTNPSGSGGTVLTRIKINGVVYRIPEGGGGGGGDYVPIIDEANILYGTDEDKGTKGYVLGQDVLDITKMKLEDKPLEDE